jgi:hypothetical protein
MIPEIKGMIWLSTLIRPWPPDNFANMFDAYMWNPITKEAFDLYLNAIFDRDVIDNVTFGPVRNGQWNGQYPPLGQMSYLFAQDYKWINQYYIFAHPFMINGRITTKNMIKMFKFGNWVDYKLRKNKTLNSRDIIRQEITHYEKILTPKKYIEESSTSIAVFMDLNNSSNISSSSN